MVEVLIDSYPETYRNTWQGMKVLHPSTTPNEESAEAQTFQGANARLTRAMFVAYKIGAPTGQLHAVLYSDSFVELARSDPVEAASLPTSGVTLRTFTFSGANQHVLSEGVTYAIAIENPTSGTINASNYVVVGLDNATLQHPGSYYRFRYNSWQEVTAELIFYVYGDTSIATADISGRVLHSDATPFSDATVELMGYYVTTTIPDGTYAFTSVTGRHYTLRASSLGYQPFNVDVDATMGGTINIPDIILVELPRVRVFGYVTYPDGGPATGVRVDLVPYGYTTTDNNGLYDFGQGNVPAGDYELQVSLAGYYPVNFPISISVSAPQDVQQNISLISVAPFGKIPIPPDGQCYHMAFCSWDPTAAPSPAQGDRDIRRFVAMVGKPLFAAEHAGTICMKETPAATYNWFYVLGSWTDPNAGNTWKPLMDAGLFKCFIISINPYIRSEPVDVYSGGVLISGPSKIEQEIADGIHDGWIKQLAQQCKNFRDTLGNPYPLIIKIGIEVNINQRGQANVAEYGATPSAYIGCWRRFVYVFTQEGVQNVTWCISYNFDHKGIYGFEDYYPGDAYIDWLGVDFYQISLPDDPVTQQAAFYAWANTKPKPLAVTEWGTNWYNKNYSDADRLRYTQDFFSCVEARERYKIIRYHWNNWWRFQDDNPADSTTYKPLTTAEYRDHVTQTRYLSEAASAGPITSVTVTPTGPIQIQVNTSQTFNATVIGGQGTIEITWYDEATGTVLGTGPSLTMSFPTEGTYYIHAIATDDVASVQSNTVTVTVNVTPPTPQFPAWLIALPVVGGVIYWLWRNRKRGG